MFRKVENLSTVDLGSVGQLTSNVVMVFYSDTTRSILCKVTLGKFLEFLYMDKELIDSKIKF